MYVGAGNQAVQSLIRRVPWDWTQALLYGGAWPVAMVAVALLQRAGCFPRGATETAGRCSGRR